MTKPRIYFIDGTAVADKGIHTFKDVVAGVNLDLEKFQRKAEITILPVNQDGIYYLREEGRSKDYGERYLFASNDVAVGGGEENGDVQAILSPIMAYSDYKNGIQCIKDILNEKPNKALLRFLYVGVCTELEGYLSSTIIALIQGVREVFIDLREWKDFQRDDDEEKWRNNIVKKINDSYQFHRIRCWNSDERKLYEKLLGEKLPITTDLFYDIDWRHKLAHKVPFFEKPIYPSATDVLGFILEADNLVSLINSKIEPYKRHWLEEY